MRGSFSVQTSPGHLGWVDLTCGTVRRALASLSMISLFLLICLISLTHRYHEKMTSRSSLVENTASMVFRQVSMKAREGQGGSGSDLEAFRNVSPSKRLCTCTVRPARNMQAKGTGNVTDATSQSFNHTADAGKTTNLIHLVDTQHIVLQSEVNRAQGLQYNCRTT